MPHYNFICSDADYDYLKKVALESFFVDGNLDFNKSELFRKIIRDHQNFKAISPETIVLLNKIAKKYKKPSDDIAKAFFKFILKNEPDLDDII